MGIGAGGARCLSRSNLAFMSTNFRIGPNDVEVARLMKYRRYVLEIAIPGLERFREAFNRSRSAFMEETRSAVERWCVINPSAALDPSADVDLYGFSFDWVTGDLYHARDN